jgi:5-methylcytosine-specific restriction endonuclease McrA
MNTKENSEESISEDEPVEVKRTLNGIIERKVEKTSKLSKREKEFLRKMLQRRDGDRCHYCKIRCGEDGMEFVDIWGKGCYGRKGKRDSGRKGLEIEHKNECKDVENDNLRVRKLWKWDNLALACPICNIAKSDQFSEEEFQEVGDVIEEIWRGKERRTKA